MSSIAIVIYELIYATVFVSLLFSRSTFFDLFPNPSPMQRLVFFLIIASGFGVPWLLQLLRVRLKTLHYLLLSLGLCLLYIYTANAYNEKILKNKRFHSFLQIPPPLQTAPIPKPEGVFRIVCLGGSTTEGDAQGNYPQELREMLRDRYPQKKFEVLNAGRYFYSSQHSIIQYLFYLQDLEPDLLIMFHGFNDLMASFTQPKTASAPYRRDYGHFYGALARIRYPDLFWDFIGRFWFADLRSPPGKALPLSEFKSLPSYERNLKTLITISNAMNVQLMLANQAHCFSPRGGSPKKIMGLTSLFFINQNHTADEQSWYAGMESINRITEKIARQNKIPFVDQAAHFKGKNQYFSDCVHMTTQGNQEKAALFLNEIVRLNLMH